MVATPINKRLGFIGAGRMATALAQGFIAGQGLPTSGLPRFQGGGIVPGPTGSPQLIMAHGGETVTPTNTSTKGGGNNYYLTINVRNELDIVKIGKLLNQDLGSKLVTSMRTWRGTGR